MRCQHWSISIAEEVSKRVLAIDWSPYQYSISVFFQYFIIQIYVNFDWLVRYARSPAITNQQTKRNDNWWQIANNWQIETKDTHAGTSAYTCMWKNSDSTEMLNADFQHYPDILLLLSSSPLDKTYNHSCHWERVTDKTEWNFFQLNRNAKTWLDNMWKCIWQVER